MNTQHGARHDTRLRRTRRQFVLSACALATLVIVKPPVAALAESAGSNASPANPDASAFMTVSRLVTGESLDARTADALFTALSRQKGFVDNTQALAKLATAPAMTVETLAAQLDASHQKALRDTLNQIVSAWYLGIVDNKTYAYQSALMYRPTADVLSPPSYVRAGALNWANATPPQDGF